MSGGSAPGRGGALGRLALLASGNAAESAILFARNLVVARLLSVEDYGIAATFALTATLIEMASQLGLRQLIVQSPEGEDPDFQAALQGFQLVRGVIGALMLLALGGPIALFLGVPEIAWAYRALAVVPLMQGLLHFDIHRFERQARFGPLVGSLTGAALISLFAVVPLHMAFGDWRVMLVALVLQLSLQTALSHLLAERRYMLRLDQAIIGRGMRFGWPLLLNGALLFLVFHGEKLIVGRELGLEMLGVFAMGVTLTLTPMLVVSKSVQSFFLPRLSRAEGTTYARLTTIVCDTNIAGGLLFIVGTALLASPLILFVLGDKYAPLLPYILPLAVLQAVRVFKNGPSVAALARARTGLAMLANLPRILSIGLVWIVLLKGGGLLPVVWIGIVGELAGAVVIYIFLARDPDLHLGRMAMRATLPMGLALLAATLDGATKLEWISVETVRLPSYAVVGGMMLWSVLALRAALHGRAIYRGADERPL